MTNRLKSFLIAIGLGSLIIAGVLVGQYHNAHHDDIYYKKFSHSIHVADKEGVVLLGECQNVRFSLQVKETSVKMSVNGDIMTGIPVFVSEENILYVKFADGKVLGFIQLKANETHDEDFLVVVSGDGQTILTNSTDCEEVTRFLDEIQP